MSYADFDYGLRIAKLAMVSTGLVGNILTFAIFSRKAFQKNSISTYCRALAVAECMLLLQLYTDVYMMLYKAAPLNTSDVMCKIVMYISVQMSAIPAWILVAFSVDKTLSMSRRQIPILKKKWFQWSVVASIVLFNLLLYVAIPITIKLQQYSTFANILYCDFATLSYFMVFIFVDLFETALIPFAIMMATSIITIRILYKSRKSLERVGKADKERKSRDTKYAVSSIVYNLLYVTLKLPNLVWYIMYGMRIPTSSYFLTITYFLFLLNLSLTFFINFASNSIFRKEFYSMFRIRHLVGEKFSTTGHSMTQTNRILPVMNEY
jgi:hypothetical protein